MSDPKVKKYHEGPLPWPEKPHIAFAGRSNVGKSSLLNALMGHKLAATSKTPGRTRAIWCFPWEQVILGDLPGFGFAQVQGELRKMWNQWMRIYFAEESPLAATVLCLDARLSPQKPDLLFLDWLKEQKPRPLILAATRCDRFNQKETHKARSLLKQYAADCHPLPVHTIMTSARKGTRVTQLRELLLNLTTSENTTGEQNG